MTVTDPDALVVGPEHENRFSSGPTANFAKGLLWLIVVVLAAVSLTFILSRVIPADPARLAAGLEAGPEQVAQVRHDLGLDRPVVVQYGNYLGGLLSGDFGDSIRTRQPVINDLLQALPASLELIVVSFAIIAGLGILLGVIWAYWPRGLHSVLLRIVAVAGSAMPVFWVGLLLQVGLAANIDWLPIAGSFNHRKFGVDEITGSGLLDSLISMDTTAITEAIRRLLLPVTTIVFHNIALTMTLMRTSMSEQLQRPYVQAARARGVSEPKVVTVDALRNALNPVVTMLGLQLGWSLGGVVIVEVIFSWPGIGLYAFSSFQAFDYNAIMAVTIIATASFVLINSLVNRIYQVLDPRIT